MTAITPALPGTPGGWAPGTCSGCGWHAALSTAAAVGGLVLVKGPPGAELCAYCDELQALSPLPAGQLPVPPPERPGRGPGLSPAAVLMIAAGLAGVIGVPVAAYGLASMAACWLAAWAVRAREAARRAEEAGYPS